MTGNERTATGEPLGERCREVVDRLAGRFAWQLDAGAAGGLVADIAAAHTGDSEPSERALEQTCCRLRFVRLYDDFIEGGARGDAAVAELFQIQRPEGLEGPVHYAGFLFRTALITIRRRLAGNVNAPDLEQLACDAASRAATTVRGRFADCRDPDAFWGWTGRVAERAAVDELRSGQATGGRSVHALSLDVTGESTEAPHESAVQTEERHVNALAVRTELIRKCRLGKLSPDQREALVRSFWGGEKPQEIAAALSLERGAPVTAAQVSLWKHRGLQVMESNLREHGFS